MVAINFGVMIFFMVDESKSEKNENWEKPRHATGPTVEERIWYFLPPLVRSSNNHSFEFKMESGSTNLANGKFIDNTFANNPLDKLHVSRYGRFYETLMRSSQT